ncbi:redoxin family protein [Lyophyllum atratum]|nr:redoxin family protein [Lyophyllum atratum]
MGNDTGPSFWAIDNLHRTMMNSSLDLPPNLPVPVDDGACVHLTGAAIPSITLISTSGGPVDVSSLKGLTIVFCYPRTGAPGETIPEAWNLIPGARGCTPQACSFRDSSTELLGLGVQHIFGLSTQDTPYQMEVKERLHLPYDLLSDEGLEWARALTLPTFDWEGKTLVKRMVIAVEDGKIVKTWYPVFPSDRSAQLVIDWLKAGKVSG